MKKHAWFMYRHINGTLHLKPYLGVHAQEIYEDGTHSPMVKTITPVYKTIDRTQAQMEGEYRILKIEEWRKNNDISGETTP